MPIATRGSRRHWARICDKVVTLQIGRRPASTGKFPAMPSEKIHAEATQQRVRIALSISAARRRRRAADVSFAQASTCADMREAWQADAVSKPARSDRIARDSERPAQFLDGLLRRKLRTLVEPFRRHQLGARTHRRGTSPSISILHTHECLGRGIDNHGANRNGLVNGTCRSEK